MSNFVPLSTARSNAQQAQIQPTIKREDRSSLDQRDYDRLWEKALQALQTKLLIMGLTKQEKGLKKTYDLTMLLNELKKHLRRYDINTFFEIINPDPLAMDRSISGTPIELIGNYTGNVSINVGTVKASTAHYRKWGQTYNLTDLEWSQELLENSCKEYLRNKVNEELMSLDYKFHGGPIYF